MKVRISLQVLSMEAELAEVQEGSHALQRKLDSATQDIVKLQQSNRELQSTLAQITNTRGRKRLRATSCLEQYSDRHKRRLLSQRKTGCTAALQWLEEDGFMPIKVEVKNVQTGLVEIIELNSEEVFGQDAESIRVEQLQTINMMLFIKDKFNVSGRAYHELAKVCKSMPRHYKLQQRTRELNAQWNIWPTPNGTCGVQQSLAERLHQRALHLHHTASRDAGFRKNLSLRVKLSGDGTNIGKRLHVINFTFTLLEEGALAYSAEGNHPLAVIKENEKYDTLCLALTDIRNDVEGLSTIEVDGCTYNITYFLGGDWKFLAICTGIDAATCTYACIWCKCSKENLPNVGSGWSITDTTKGARTVEENTELGQKRKKQFNVSHTPLFPSIPLSNVVIDNLHMFLRVSDVLITQLIDRLKAEDAIEKAKKFSNLDVSKHKHLKAYEDFVGSLGIPSYHFYVGQTSKTLKVRSLIGTEKLKVTRNIKIRELLPSAAADECERIQDLWDNLLSLNSLFSKRPEDVTEDNISEYETKSREWVEKFLKVYHRRYVTPYIHAMACHVGQFMRIHGSILPFTQQGMEKFNDNVTKTYFQATNHKGTVALTQVLQKQNRLEHLADRGAQPPKHHEIVCSQCHGKGHNRRTCGAQQQ